MTRGEPLPSFERYFGAALLTCGIVWLWDFIASLFFPGQAALNLTLLSAMVYTQAAFLGALGLTRRMFENHVHVGIRVGLIALAVNMIFRLIVFDLGEAMWGLVVYLASFIAGGFLGGLFAKIINKSSIEDSRKL